MNVEILEEIGLTKTEIKIYIALLKLGESTTTNLIREAEIHASKVYEYLDRLISKGLVTYSIKSNKKHFSVTDPIFLKEFLKEKQNNLDNQSKKIDDLIPELIKMQKFEKDKIEFQVYEGIKGIKSFYEHILEAMDSKDVSHLIGAPKIANEILEAYLLDWHKRRIKKGIHCKYIYDSDVRSYGEVRKKMKDTEVKYLPKNISSPMWIEISKDYVGIGHIKSKNAVIFSIKDKEIAKGYLDYFEILWKASKY